MSDITNSIGGDITGTAIQAGDITGGISFGSSKPAVTLDDVKAFVTGELASRVGHTDPVATAVSDVLTEVHQLLDQL
jgi:hypothetical protein